MSAVVLIAQDGIVKKTEFLNASIHDAQGPESMMMELPRDSILSFRSGEKNEGCGLGNYLGSLKFIFEGGSSGFSSDKQITRICRFLNFSLLMASKYIG